ncbi:Scr1 family TA system antitoxin-like transcriptional regulator [Streptomyces sp. NPDC005499]|uniref:helix-turn-helix domain-containing protein n=1 Tax=Streptomyces sp. NPDC005499 TaxID=3154883 RepID=UPI0033A5091F
MALNTAAMAARKRFGDALQEARKAARLPTGELVQQRDVARALGYKSYNRVSQMERGLTWPKDSEWKILVKVLAMDLATRVRLETMIAEGKATAGAWWTEFEGEFPESLLQFVAFEDAAQRITTCAVNVLPALLQTKNYARSVTTGIAGSVLTSDAVERSVELRRNRRSIFTKANPPSVELIFSEAALRQEAGGRQVMVEQLDSLIEDGSSRTVSLRVVPFTAPVPSMHILHLLEFGGQDEKPLTAFDSMTGMTFQKRPKDVRENRYYIEVMRKLAFSSVESMAMIKSIRKEFSSA